MTTSLWGVAYTDGVCSTDSLCIVEDHLGYVPSRVPSVFVAYVPDWEVPKAGLRSAVERGILAVESRAVWAGS